MVTSRIVKTPYSPRFAASEKQWEWTLKCLVENIRNRGHLVVFPTETVYGLGANALDAQAVLRIFEAKRRPLSDPVICHVANRKHAEDLYSCTEAERAVIRALAFRLWPGPLSLVARAAPHVPPEVTASTGFVAVRYPEHPVAMALLRAVDVPLAAPSANRFGRISPSTPEHVAKDFREFFFQSKQEQPQEDLCILDGGPCIVGIESTVCKVEEIARGSEPSSDSSSSSSPSSPLVQLTVLRRGSISCADIDQVLRAAGFLASTSVSDGQSRSLRYCVQLSETMKYLERCNDGAIERYPSTAHKNSVTFCSPGMLLKHYAPCLPTFLFHRPAASDGIVLCNASVCLQLPGSNVARTKGNDCCRMMLARCVLVDPDGSLSNLRQHVLKYICVAGDPDDPEWHGISLVKRMQINLFAALHQAEENGLQEGAQAILIGKFEDDLSALEEGALSVYDRLFRAASGRVVSLCSHQEQRAQ